MGKGSMYGTSFRGIVIESTNLYIQYSEKQIFVVLSHAWQGIVFLFIEGTTKCSEEVYNKVTGIRQHNKHLFGVYRLHVSTC